jgi:polysaccharide chain length determinant protein (PEP-CTERM system associated)
MPMGKVREKFARRQPVDSIAVGDFSLCYLLEVLFRRKWVLALPVLLLPIMAFSVTFLMPSSYMSSSTILLGKGEILNPLVRFETAVSITDWNRLSSFQKIIYSRPVIEQVIQELNLDTDVKTDVEREWLVEDVRKSVQIMSLTADSFQIGCSARTPELARDMVETITRIFIEKSLAGSRREASVAVSFIQKQVDYYRRELEEQQERMRTFKLKNIDTLRRVPRMNDELEKYRTAVIDLEMTVREKELSYRLLKQRLAGEKPMVVSQALFTQRTPYKGQYQNLMMKLGNLLATRDESHPEVKKIKRELDFITKLLEQEKEADAAVDVQKVRSPVYESILARADEAEIAIQVYGEKLKTYRDMYRDLSDKIEGVPELEREEAQLRSTVDSTRELYDSLKLKLEFARISREVEIEQQSNRFTIVDPPRAPLRRNKPNRKKFAFAGVAGGVSLGFLLVFLLEFTDPRVVRQGQLERMLDRELIGSIPKIHSSPGTQRLLLLNLLKNLLFSVPALFLAKRFVLPKAMMPDFLLDTQWLNKLKAGPLEEDSNDDADDDLRDDDDELVAEDDDAMEPLCDLPLFVEKIRQISFAARSSMTDPEGFLCGITSTVKGEGKTLLAGNLAAIVAHDFKKPVLLIDGHLRHASLSERFARPGAPGLAQVVAGEVSLADALVATDMPLLQVLPAGQCQEAPICLFRSSAFLDFLDSLRQQFSLVLVELPSVRESTESQVMADKMDGLLIMVNMYSTKLRTVHAAVHRLKRDKIIGFVTNGTEYWIPDWLYRWV